MPGLSEMLRSQPQSVSNFRNSFASTLADAELLISPTADEAGFPGLRQGARAADWSQLLYDAVATVTPEPGDTLLTAYNVGLVGSLPVTLTDAVSVTDRYDYYSFTLETTSNFNLTLTGLSADADVRLVSSNGTFINSSLRLNNLDETINQTLDPGTYYVRVAQFTGNTAYNLRLSATAASPSIAPSNLLASEGEQTLALTTLGSTPLILTDSISNIDTTDVFQINLATSGTLSVILTGLMADLDVRLIQDVNNNGLVDETEEIARSQNVGSADETLNLSALAAGSYFVQVYQYAGSTSYTLQLASQSATGSDNAGNTLATARDLGGLSVPNNLVDFVGTADTNDYYRFTLDATSSFRLSLTDLTTDADVQLFDGNGVVLATSNAAGTNAEAIARTLAAGTYYVRVYQYSGDTRYNLYLSATTLNLPPGYSSIYGYGLVNAAAAVAQALGEATQLIDVPDLGGNDWGLDLVHAPEVWARNITGQGITVAVVDSGVDINHPDLNDNIWLNVGEVAGNGIDDDGNGYVDDIRGWDFVDSDNDPMDLSDHGTHVAGTIAAENNGFGVTGVAYNARIMPVRVLDAEGYGSWSAIAEGVRYAARNGADVINLSLGGSGFSSELATAVEYATQQGAVVVIASGNESESQPTFPANLAERWGIAVGAVNRNNQVASFSNLAGASPLSYVVAPGANVYSTTPNNTYSNFNGTSMATPHVAGVAALIMSANPNLTPAQVVSLLTGTADANGITTA